MGRWGRAYKGVFQASTVRKVRTSDAIYMDREAWRAAVHGVAERQRRLSD